MASINGVSIKNLKTFMGKEGPTTQGTVYLNGKKLGFWFQSSHGGPDNFEFDKGLLRDEVLLAESSDPAESHEFYTLAMLMYDIVQLMKDEKWYKRFEKKGKSALAIVYRKSDHYPIAYEGYSSKSQSGEDELLKSLRKAGRKASEMSVTWFLSPDDFNISRGDPKSLTRLRAEADKKEADAQAAFQAAAEKQKAEIEEIDRVTERFSFNPVQDAPAVLVKDKVTGRTTQVPNYAITDVKRALADLVIGDAPQKQSCDC